MSDTHSEEQPKQPRGINATAIIAGTLASLSAAVVASFFGVAGTLIGTAVVSIVSSLAAVIYSGLLGATKGLVQRRTTVLRALQYDRARPDGRAQQDGKPPAGDAGDGGAAGDRGAAGGRGVRAWSPPRRWLTVGGLALLIFAIAIGTLTGIEAAIKEPLASALGVRDRGQARTSIGVAVDRAGGSSGQPSSSSSSSSSTPSPSSTSGGGQPGQAPSSTAPGPSTTGGAGASHGGTAPPTTLPTTTSQPSTRSTSGATSSSR
jgi:hypothetical protein